MSSRSTAALLISLPLVACCSYAPQSSGDLDVRAGCAVVSARQSMIGSQVVMDVSATGCHDPDRRPSSDADAVGRLAQAVWQSLRLPVDAIHVRVRQPLDASGISPVVITSEELKDRFGRGPSGVVWPALERDTDENIWFLLPIAYLVVGLAVLGLARHMARCGVVVVLFRR